MKKNVMFVFVPLAVAVCVAAVVAHGVWNQYQERQVIEADYAAQMKTQAQFAGAPVTASEPSFEEKKAYYEMTHHPSDATTKAYYETMLRLHPALAGRLPTSPAE